MEQLEDRANTTNRAQWLAELADALEQAQKLAWALGISEGSNAEAKELYSRLEEVRIEVECLRLGRWHTLGADIDPSWLSLLS